MTAPGPTPEVENEPIKPAWMPPALFEQWKAQYIEAGGTGNPYAATVATEWLRQSPDYETYFPGIKREDGSLRMTEANYYNTLDSYRNIIEGVDVNPEMLEQNLIDLIEGDVSPTEFAARVNNIYQRVALAGDDIREYYMNEFDLDMTNSSLIASLMDPNLGDAILNRQITMAEIGGEASERNFDITGQFVDMLAEQGMNRDEADRLFGSAEKMLPALSALAARHGDPDDTFDVTEFASAAGYGEGGPEQERRIKRLQAQESSAFTGGGAIDYVRNKAGGVAGLQDI